MILACDRTGYPRSWMNREDAIIAKVKGLIAYEFGEYPTVMRGGISRMTGEQSVIDVMSIVVIKGKPSMDERTPALNNHNLFRRDNHVCAYCSRIFGNDKLTRDHIIPRSRGGKDNWMNVVTACRDCNCEKDNHLLEECGKELLYLPYIPSKCEELILKNRRILGSQMELLKQYVPINSRAHGIQAHA